MSDGIRHIVGRVTSGQFVKKFFQVDWSANAVNGGSRNRETRLRHPALNFTMLDWCIAMLWSVRPSARPSARPSVRPSVRPSARPVAGRRPVLSPAGCFVAQPCLRLVVPPLGRFAFQSFRLSGHSSVWYIRSNTKLFVGMSGHVVTR